MTTPVPHDLPPPLEDCSRLLIRKNRSNSANGSHNAPSTFPVLTGNPSTDTKLPNEPTSTASSPSAPPKSTIKRGFFNQSHKPASPAVRTSNTASKPDVIEVVPRARPEDSLRFAEVQEAMNNQSGSSFLKKDDKSWLNADLMRRIATDPVISASFANPRFQDALALMQKDPMQAKAKYMHDTQVTAALNRYMQVLGEHFESLALKQEKQKPEMDEETQRIFGDPGVQRVLELLKQGVRIHPKQLPPGVFEKIKFLMDKNFIKIENF